MGAALWEMHNEYGWWRKGEKCSTLQWMYGDGDGLSVGFGACSLVAHCLFIGCSLACGCLMRKGAYGSWRIAAAVSHWLSSDCSLLVDAPRYVPTWVGWEQNAHSYHADSKGPDTIQYALCPVGTFCGASSSFYANKYSMQGATFLAMVRCGWDMGEMWVRSFCPHAAAYLSDL